MSDPDNDVLSQDARSSPIGKEKGATVTTKIGANEEMDHTQYRPLG